MTVGVTAIKAVHFTDLRAALTQAYQAAGKPAQVDAESSVVARTTLIKASHLTELRTLVRNLE